MKRRIHADIRRRSLVLCKHIDHFSAVRELLQPPLRLLTSPHRRRPLISVGPNYQPQPQRNPRLLRGIEEDCVSLASPDTARDRALYAIACPSTADPFAPVPWLRFSGSALSHFDIANPPPNAPPRRIMSTATTRKPPPPGTPTRDQAAKVSPSPAAGRRTSTTPSTPTTNNGVTRTRSVRSGANGTPVSARAAVRKPGASSSLSMSSSQVDGPDDEARDEAAAYLADLKERLQKAETSADERQKQIDVLHARLDEALKEQSKLEERAHEEEEKVESLENEKREITRQQRELEAIYEAERAQAIKEKETTLAREDELQATIQRLKDTMATKNVTNSDGEGELSRTCK